MFDSLLIPLLAAISSILIAVIGFLILNKSKPQKVSINTATNTESARIVEMLQEDDVSNTKYGTFYKRTFRPYFKKNPGTMEQLIESLKLNREELETQIHNAGLTKSITVEEYVSMQLLGLAGLIIFFLTAALTGQYGIGFFGLLSFFLGAYVPQQVIKLKVDTKRHAIEVELPEFLDLARMSTESGLNIQDSLNKVALRIDSPLANEFKGVMAETKAIGGDWKAAIHNMLKRNNVDVLTDIMSDILIATEKGTPIADTLAKDISLMRNLKINRINEKANKSVTMQVLAMMVFDVIPLLIMLLTPAVITIAGGF